MTRKYAVRGAALIAGFGFAGLVIFAFLYAEAASFNKNGPR